METQLAPPLLPWPYDEEGVELEPPRFDLALMSGDSEGLDRAEELERRIEQMDTLRMCDMTGLDLNIDTSTSDDTDIFRPCAEMSSQKRKLDKLDVPLLPADAKHLKLTDTKDILAQHTRSAAPWPTPGDEPSSDDGTATLVALLAPLATRADQLVEQERLNDKQTSLRLAVPPVDRTPAVLPWEKYSRLRSSERFASELDAQRRLIGELLGPVLAATREWPGGKAVERTLVWRPFPRERGAVTVEERMEDTEYLLALMQNLRVEEPVACEASLQKAERLRILDQDDEDDEIAFAEFGDDEMDVDYVLRKVASALPGDTPSISRVKRTMDTAVAPPNVKRHKSDADIFSASSSLRRFFALQGVTIPESASTAPAHPPASLPAQRPAPPTESKPSPRIALPRPPPLPPLPPTKPPRVAIASTAILTTRRPLIQALRALYPSLTLLERDFSTITPTPAYLRAPSSSASAADEALLAEADILLSPTTGLVLTTLQRIAQLPLPGRQQQAAAKGEAQPLPPFHARLRTLAARYPRLIVLVSQGTASAPGILSAPSRRAAGDAGAASGTEGHGDGEEEGEEEDTPVPSSATRALARLVRAAARCAPRCLVAVQFAPGGDAALARWVAWHAIRSGCAPSSSSSSSSSSATAGGTDGGGAEDAAADAASLGDETAAEAVLRRAGLNAFAAAAVLARLRAVGLAAAPSSSSPAGGSDGPPTTPLAAFVAMDPRRRAARFARLLGGAAVAERVGRALERRWISASEGFAR
jgi:hypothetical protein